MPDYTIPQWQAQARSVAINTGIDPAIFSGLVEQESGWNPNAQAKGSSAFGFTQLTNAAASDAGVNKFDPMQNLQGGANYFKSLLDKFGGNYSTALAAYNQGAHGILSKGEGYANSILQKAKKYIGGTTVDDVLKGLAPMGVDAVASAIPGAGLVTSVLGIGGGDSCALNPICYLQKWLKETDFVQRSALYILGTIFIIGAIVFLAMGYKPVQNVTKAALV
jgi:hypothetical protein